MSTGKAGRPPFEPTEKDRRQVRLLSGMGVPDYDIAKVIGLSLPTLRKYFAGELELGHIEANAAVAQSLYKMATNRDKPNVAAAIFWLKCRAGWKEGETAAPPPLGKKEQAEENARSADKGTTWESLLHPPGLQ